MLVNVLLLFLLWLADGQLWVARPGSSTPFDDTVLASTTHFFTFNQRDDSWRPMSRAFSYLHSKDQLPVYDYVFFDRGVKFQYPPSSLLILKALSLPPMHTLLTTVGLSSIQVVKSMSWLFIVVMAFFVIKIFNQGLANAALPGSVSAGRLDSLVRTGVLLCLILTFYPVVYAYTLGQIQIWINCAVAALVWCWLKDKKTLSGVLTAAVCLIKPQYSVLLVWGLLRREWTFAKAFLATALAGLSLSILAFGYGNHLNYLNVLSFLSQRGEVFYANQSINGLLNRLFFNGDILETHAYFPAFNSWVYAGTIIGSLLLIGMALLWPLRTPHAGGAADLCIVLLASTMSSPIAWEHHYGILLPMYALIVPIGLKHEIFGRWTLHILCLSYILASNLIIIFNGLSYTYMNLVQSYLLFAALIVLYGFYVLARRGQQSHSVSVTVPAPTTMSSS